MWNNLGSIFINTRTGEGLRITRPGGGHYLPLSLLPASSAPIEELETRNIEGGNARIRTLSCENL